MYFYMAKINITLVTVYIVMNILYFDDSYTWSFYKYRPWQMGSYSA